MPAGRPSKYNEEVLVKTEDYILNFSKYGDLIPSVAGLACELGVTRETVRAWGKEEDKAEFSAMLGKMLSRQERTLLSGGLGGNMNANICKLVLAKHNYSDKQEIEAKDTTTLIIRGDDAAL